MSFEHQFPYGDVNELNLDWIIQTMQEFINSEREAGHTPTVSGVKSFFTHKYPYGSIHELNLDWVIQTALRMEEIGDSVEGDIGELQTRMTSAETNITVLNNAVGGLNDSVDQIETEIGNINDDVDAVETTTAQHTTQIAALDDKIDSQVVANPAGAATDTLDTIEIAGTVYEIQGSGGGSEVEPNPAGEPTDTLEKIGIDGTVYEVGGSEPVSKTATGNPIHIEDAADAPIVSGEVTFEPKQDLHGYDKPWAGGAGVNLFNCAISGGSASSLDITFTNTYDSDGNVLGVKSSGTSTGYAQLNIGVTLPAGTYKTNVTGFDGSKMDMNIRTTSGWLANPNTSFTLNAETMVIIRYFVNEGKQGGNTILCTLYKYSGTDLPFFPYTNICPITGYTDCEVEVKGKNLCYSQVNNTGIATLEAGTYTLTYKGNYAFNLDIMYDGDTSWTRITSAQGVPYTFTLAKKGTINLNAFNNNISHIQVELGSTATTYEPYQSTTYAIDLDGTRYGGKVYPVTGKMSVGIGRIASYNGESIGEPWLSDRDEYVQGTTPTTGAEVVYTLASPTIVQLTPQQIRTLEGTNNISTNMTNMSLKYITQDYQSLVKLIERSAGHHYSEQERVVGAWFGKPLYERSYSVSTPATVDTVNQIIAVPTNSVIVNMFGMYNNQFPINFYYDTDNRIETWLNNAKTYVVNRTPYSLMLNLSGTVTIQYTKTTD